MTYNVMLVDDESVDLEWLRKRVNWEALGFHVTAVMQSSFKALEYLKQHDVHVLVTDINMPILSGLELVRRAKEYRSDMLVVFISGHEEFEYARKAIELNAVGYVLKPFEDDQLLDLLGQVVHQLDQSRAEKEEKLKYAKSMPLLKNELILSWLQHSTLEDMDDIHALVSAYLPSCQAIHEQAAVVLIEIDDMEWKLNSYPNDEKKRMLQSVYSIIESEVRNAGFGMPIRYAEHRTILFTGNHVDETKRKMSELLIAIRKLTVLTVTIAIGNVVSSVFELPLSFEQAKQLLSRKMFLGKNRILEQADLVVQQATGIPDVEADIEAIFFAMSEYQLVAVDDRLQKLFHYINRLESKVTVFHYVIHLIHSLNEQFKKVDEDVYKLLHWDYKHLDILFQFETIRDIQSWLRRRLFELSELLYSSKQKQNRKVINQIKEYVRERIESKCTLREVAHVFSFSPNYLGFLFKEETGENFSDYLLRSKLDYARILLLDSSIKIYEVTERVGYKNVVYFNKHFKEKYGMTPTEYRKLNKV